MRSPAQSIYWRRAPPLPRPHRRPAPESKIPAADSPARCFLLPSERAFPVLAPPLPLGSPPCRLGVLEQSPGPPSSEFARVSDLRFTHVRLAPQEPGNWGREAPRTPRGHPARVSSRENLEKGLGREGLRMESMTPLRTPLRFSKAALSKRPFLCAMMEIYICGVQYGSH